MKKNNFEEYDKLKTKVLKYVLYKKRSQNEVKLKFRDENENLLEQVIDELKQNNYINDDEYINKTVNEFMRLKNLSIQEIKYKLLQKGIQNSLIEEYIDKNIDTLEQFELQSIKNIIIKKQTTMDDEQIKKYLLKKGYKIDNV